MSLLGSALLGAVSVAYLAMAPLLAAEDGDLPPWAKWAVSGAAFLAALRYIAKVARSFAQLSADIDRFLPVLREIAEQFRDASGHSTLKTQLDDLKTQAEANGHKLDDLHDYTHKHRHDLSNQIQQILLKLPPTPKENP